MVKVGAPRKNLMGIGVNDWEGNISEIRQEYHKWSNMINRCYGDSPSNAPWRGCVVREDWFLLSNFLKWIYSQSDWQLMDLDKDILFIGNRTYSPDHCLMVHPSINRHFRGNGLVRNLPIGITELKPAKNGERRFLAQGRSGAGNKIALGHFRNIGDAHAAWQRNKISQLRDVRPLSQDDRVTGRIDWEVDRILTDISRGAITEWY